MATYLEGNSEMQAEAEGEAGGGGGDGVQTLVLMNPGYLQYSETTPSSNLLLLNSMGNMPASHQQQFLGIPLSNQHQSMFLPMPTPRALSLTLSNAQSGFLTSNYLKAAQELLHEAVHVHLNNFPTNPPTKPLVSAKPASHLSAADTRQDIQMKKAKLINMLDQVEQRYTQYQQQMHLVISSFEQAAGIGSATIYTSLALQTISKQFRCLKDAITAQIRGQQDCLTPKLESSSLKYVDHHLRQHNAWRPQRGLPEPSVSVLRAWLFEHFLHPYPKDSDKHMLAKQTGLTRSQVSNWFINARVRLWKPMVEEMYMEEMKEQEQNGCHEDKSSQDPSAAAASETDAKSSLNSKQDVSSASNHNNNPTVASPAGAGGHVRKQFGFSFMGSSELEGITQASPKKPRNHDMMPPSPTSINMDVKPNEISNEQVSLKFGDDQRQGRDGYSFMENQTNFMGAFGQYPIGEIGRFDAAQHFAPRFSGNGVSLTLGLPHCDTLSGTHHQTFLPNHNNIQLGTRLEMGEANEFGGINPSTPHSSAAAAAAFENINMQNPKRFVAQLLPDFVT